MFKIPAKDLVWAITGPQAMGIINCTSDSFYAASRQENGDKVLLKVAQFIQEGANTLSVKLTNKEFASRWYPGAGLYRNVSVIIKNNVSIDQWGQFITTPFISKEVAKVKIKTKVSGENTRLVTTIFDAEGHKLNSEESTTQFGKEFDQNIKVENIIQKHSLFVSRLL